MRKGIFDNAQLYNGVGDYCKMEYFSCQQFFCPGTGSGYRHHQKHVTKGQAVSSKSARRQIIGIIIFSTLHQYTQYTNDGKSSKSIRPGGSSSFYR
jgi:hypothetical protein